MDGSTRVAIKGDRTISISFSSTAKLPIDGVVARAEFGASGRGCSPTHESHAILSQAHATQHASITKKRAARRQAVTVANSW
ncbi:hypothetical protein Zmor_026340 [Zophobas morio]|uniref:Uncharacterized protein n=1 Tax=Zophobas morio TaxID=2755281 RepID=A0AA38M4F2_9CUCU|nr:hypothetical protein Zmor_026340 [Zophobas morio]